MVVCGNSGAYTRGRRVIGWRAASARLAVPVSSRSLDPKLLLCDVMPCCSSCPPSSGAFCVHLPNLSSIPQSQIRPFASRQTAGSLLLRPVGCTQSDGLADWRTGGRHSAPTCTHTRAAAPSCTRTRENGRHPACPYSWMPVASARFAVCKPRQA